MAPLYVQMEASQPSNQQVCPFWALSLPTLGSQSAHSWSSLSLLWPLSPPALGAQSAHSGGAVCPLWWLSLQVQDKPRTGQVS